MQVLYISKKDDIDKVVILYCIVILPVCKLIHISVMPVLNETKERPLRALI